MKILLIDIETSPIVGYSWGLYEQDIVKRIKTFTILSVAYQWLGEKTQVIACDDNSEKELLKKLHHLLTDADVVVAHNGDSFDIKKINARFLVHKLPPPSPYKTVDTKKEAKKIAAFDSNSLNNLGVDLDEGEKIKHRGFDMWEGCMANKRRDWNDMKRYNKKDVDLLAKVYLRLRPWMKNHPDSRLYTDGPKEACPKCLSKKTQRRGVYVLTSAKYEKRQCQDCGGWFKGDRLKKEIIRRAA